MAGRVVLVTRPGRPKPRSPIAWLVGVVAMTEALLQTGESFFAGRTLTALWWLGGAAFLFMVAFQVEAFKGRRGG